MDLLWGSSKRWQFLKNKDLGKSLQRIFKEVKELKSYTLQLNALRYKYLSQKIHHGYNTVIELWLTYTFWEKKF